MKHQKIEGIVEKRFEKINEAFEQARLHFEEDDIRIFRVKVKKLAACLQLIDVVKDHHPVKIPHKIAKLNQLFGEIRTLQIQQNHILSAVKEYKTGSPDASLKLIEDQILQQIAEVSKHTKRFKSLKNAEETLLTTLPRQLNQEQIQQFVSSEGDKLAKLFDPIFPSNQSFHEARKHLKNLLYISPYTEMEIEILSPYKLLCGFDSINAFTKLLGEFHDFDTTLNSLYKMAQKVEASENEKAILRRLEQIWMSAKQALRIKIYDELQKIKASGRTVKPEA